jgi:hypothetical protein
MAREIPLTQGYVAMVDDEDWARVSRFRWHAVVDRRGVYARGCADRGRKMVRMHRFILEAPDGVDVDHWDSNGLDNRRCNLRLATDAQNHQNQKLRRDSQSGFKGVSFRARQGTFQVRITAHGRRLSLGYFTEPEEAARAYDRAARIEFGEFASLNFPLPGERSAR